MTNPDFKKNSIVVTAALILAAAILAGACILPEVMIATLWKSASPLLEKAKAAAYSGRFDEAGEYADRVRMEIEESSAKLKLFFGHEDISELNGAAVSAAAIAATEDSAQLMQELCRIQTALDYLLRINEAGVADIF